MSLAEDIERILGEARMRDVRKHQVKAPSGAQIDKSFKEALQAVSVLGGKLQGAGMRDLGREVSDYVGRIIAIQKRFAEVRDRGDLTGVP